MTVGTKRGMALTCVGRLELRNRKRRMVKIKPESRIPEVAELARGRGVLVGRALAVWGREARGAGG